MAFISYFNLSFTSGSRSPDELTAVPTALAAVWVGLEYLNPGVASFIPCIRFPVAARSVCVIPALALLAATPGAAETAAPKPAVPPLKAAPFATSDTEAVLPSSCAFAWTETAPTAAFPTTFAAMVPPAVAAVPATALTPPLSAPAAVATATYPHFTWENLSPIDPSAIAI